MQAHPQVGQVRAGGGGGGIMRDIRTRQRPGNALAKGSGRQFISYGECAWREKGTQERCTSA